MIFKIGILFRQLHYKYCILNFPLAWRTCEIYSYESKLTYFPIQRLLCEKKIFPHQPPLSHVRNIILTKLSFLSLSHNI